MEAVLPAHVGLRCANPTRLILLYETLRGVRLVLGGNATLVHADALLYIQHKRRVQ